MNHGSLFSGIGGFDLAAEWAGIETKWQVEKDAFCRAVLTKHWPNVKRYEDIKECKGLESVDIISGGFPCQPFSVAGKRGGKQDDRYLWPEMLRVIAEVKPHWVIGENVAGIIAMELDSVLASLEDCGYTAWPLVIPACAAGAIHRRDRVWIVANTNKPRLQRRNSGVMQERGAEWTTRTSSPHVADTISNAERRTHRETIRRSEQGWENENQRKGYEMGSDTSDSGRNASYSASRRLPDWCGGEMGQPEPLTKFERPDGSISTTAEQRDKTYREIERDFRGMAYGVSLRVDRLKSLGNAIVPQVAYQIFKAIKEVEG